MADARLLLPLLSLLCFQSISADVLELDKCFVAYKGEVIHDKTIHRTNGHIFEKKNVRSIVDCASNCMDTYSCWSIFYYDLTNGGMCYMMNSHSISDLSPTDRYAMTGKFSALALSGDQTQSSGSDGDCRSFTCPSETRCFMYCDPSDSNRLEPFCMKEDSYDCDVATEFTNIQHYFVGITHSDTDNGVVQHVPYTKEHSDSGIRVQYWANFLAHHQQDGCGRLYFTFNGHECSNPGPIDYLSYNVGAMDLRRQSHIDGTCYGIGSGAVTVEVRSGACPGYGTSNCQVGFKASRQLTIMEVLPRSGTKPCPGTPVFNYAYQSISHYTNYHDYNQVAFTMTYSKIASDTTMRIKYQATLRSHMEARHHKCSRWFVAINGHECSPKTDLVIHSPEWHQTYDYFRDHFRTYTIEGMCDGWGIGTYTIQIKTHHCYYTQNEKGYFEAGWNSHSRMHIEEVRYSKQYDAVELNDGTVMRTPFNNIYRWQTYNWNRGEDHAEIFAVDYVKHQADTALRMTASGNHRIINYNDANWHGCTRWYFLIDYNECGNPGKVEGSHYNNRLTLFYANMHVGGICNGISAASHRISYYVGYCEGYSKYTEAYTGWGSSFHIFIEEIHLESTDTCQTGQTVYC